MIIRGLEIKEEKRREAVKKIVNEIGVEVKVSKVWKITGEKEKRREAVEVRI